MAIEHSVDAVRRRVFVTPPPTARGSAVSDLIISLVEARPELARWDWVHDIRNASGDADQEDRVAKAFASALAGEPAPAAITIFITQDPGFPLWAKVMDGFFPGRRHLTATTPEMALIHLETARTG